LTGSDASCDHYRLGAMEACSRKTIPAPIVGLTASSVPIFKPLNEEVHQPG
jgi:hypothetical protein